MTPEVEAAASLCMVSNRPGQATYCLIHGRNSAPGHVVAAAAVPSNAAPLIERKPA